MKRLLLVFFASLMLACIQHPSLSVHVKYYSPYPLAFYNAYYNQKIPDLTIYIRNLSPNPVRVKVVSEYLGYSYEAINTLKLNPGECVVLNQTIPLNLSRIKLIQEETYIPLHCSVQVFENGRWVNWSEQTFMVRVYPIDCMVWAVVSGRRLVNMQDYIAVFVTPNSKAIRELLAKAKEFAPKHELMGRNGYSVPQVEAIFDALKFDYNMSYVNTPFFYGKDYVQRVRLPSESLKLGAMNCVDGAVLFASALEALGIKTYIALLPNHAFVAWKDPKNGLMYALETTLINSSFPVALNKGLEELNKNLKNLTDSNPWNGHLVDIDACRKVGILPLN